MKRSIDKAEARVDWTQDAEAVSRQVRGLAPFPGAWTTVPDGTTLRIHSTRLSHEGLGGEPGTVHATKQSMHVQCGDGALEVLRLQAQGKPAMDTKDFLNGLRAPLRTLG